MYWQARHEIIVHVCGNTHNKTWLISVQNSLNNRANIVFAGYDAFWNKYTNKKIGICADKLGQSFQTKIQFISTTLICCWFRKLSKHEHTGWKKLYDHFIVNSVLDKSVPVGNFDITMRDMYCLKQRRCKAIN